MSVADNKPEQEYIYQNFEYDSSVINGNMYRGRLLHQGWQGLENSDEIERYAWPLDYDRMIGRRKNVDSITLKRPKEQA